MCLKKEDFELLKQIFAKHNSNSLIKKQTIVYKNNMLFVIIDK